MQPAYLPEGRPAGPGRLWNAFAGLCILWAAGFCLSIPLIVTGAGGAFWLPALIVAPALSVGRGLPVALPERVRRSCGCACR